MASSNTFGLFAFLYLVFSIFFFFSENKSFVSAIRSEEDSELQLTHHRVPLSSLFPSSSCSTRPHYQGGNKNGSLEVVHKYGPCSKLRQPSSSSSSFIIPHREILQHDKARVKAILSKLSKRHQNHHQEEAGLDDGVQIPANSGIPIGNGNYYVTVGLGSPKRSDLSLEFDTGSVVTWTQCEPCLDLCFDQKDPVFDPSKSSSYANITCPSSLCSSISRVFSYKCYSPVCLYGVKYGYRSFSIGFYAKETLTISSTDVFDNFIFGCCKINIGRFQGTAGLLGLGRGPVSIVEQTAQKYGKIFSYCLPSTPNTIGYLNFGGVSSNTNIKYIPFSSNFRNSSLYVLDLTGIAFGGTNLPIAASVFSRGTVVDSGTVITRLPPAAYGPLSDAFQKFMSARYPKGDSDDLLGTCYDLSGYKSFSVPSISLLFKGEVKVELAGIGVVYAASQKQVCLGFAKDGGVAIIGNTQQKTLEIVYDVGGERIGFRPLGCN